MTRSMIWNRPEDLSVDHLASETLLGRSSHEQTRTRASSMSSAPVELSHFHSAVSLTDTHKMQFLENPPPMPPLPTGNLDRRGPVQHFLPAPIAKPKTPTKGKNESARFDISAPILSSSKPKTPTEGKNESAGLEISAPILSSSGPSDHALLSKFDGAYLKDINTPRVTSSDAANLSLKISHLAQQAAAQEAQNNALPEKTSRPSPLQRGKHALVKASRALGIRIHSSSSSIGKQATSSIHGDVAPGSSNGSVPSSTNTSADNSPTRIELRMAEGENLRKDKVQRIMGDGFVPRKPLPGSMPARPPSPDLTIEDPFVEAHYATLVPMNGTISSPAPSTDRRSQRGTGLVASSNSATLVPMNGTISSPAPSTHRRSQRGTGLVASSNSPLKATNSLGPPRAESSASPKAVSGKGKQAEKRVSSNISTRMAAPTALNQSNAFSGPTQNTKRIASAAVPVASPTPRASRPSLAAFSDSKSGLAQHPDTMCFASAPTPLNESCSSTLSTGVLAVTPSPDGELLSSSPVDLSTSHVHLQRQSTPDGEKELVNEPHRDTSLDESNEYGTASYHNRATNRKLSVKTKTPRHSQIKDRKLSIKRKDGTEDLRSRISPAKRTKTARVLLDGPNEESGLSMETDPLGTADRHAFAVKDRNRKVSIYANDTMDTYGDVKYDLSVEKNKNKETLVSPVDTTSLISHKRVGPGKRFRFRKLAYHSTQKSHTELPLTMDDVATETDELQTWDLAYHVGGKKRQ